MATDIRVVSFDLDGTLVEETFDDIIWFEEIPRRYAARYGLSFEEAKARVVADYRALRGHRRWTDLAFWFERFDLGDWREATAAHEHMIRLFPETAEVLRALAPRYRLTILTQAERKFYLLKLKALRLEAEELVTCFERILATPEHFGKLAKDEAVYREVLRQLEIAPSEMLHVGDHREYDYEVPQRVGIVALHLDRSGARQGPEVIHNLRELLPRLVGETTTDEKR